MAVLALDLGTTTGWVLQQRGGSRVHGIWKLRGNRFEGGGMRFLRFRGELMNIHAHTSVQAVFYEEVRAHKGTDAAHIYGALWGTLTAFCEERDIPYEGVPVGKIKKFMTGKGNAGKPQMIAAVRKYGFEGVADDNEADAIAIMLMKMEDPVVQAILGV